MKQRVIQIIATLVIITSCFVTGFNTGYIVSSVPTVIARLEQGNAIAFQSEGKNTGGIPARSLETRFKPFWDAWDIVHRYYVDQPVDDEALMEGAIRGMLNALGDPHTRYSDPKSYQEESDYMAGEEYEGIGAWVDISGDFVQITTPMKGSPAEKAGLRPKDLVIKIDGDDMTGIDTQEALNKILGPKGSTVILTIKRGDQEPFDVSVVRSAIVTPMVISEMREDGIAYIQLTQFGDLTTAELKEALASLLPEKPKGLILDLRNNGGGYVDTCVQVASEFLPKDSLVLIEREGDGSETNYKTRKTGLAQDIPLVVLGNEGTASASEILIGALQYYQRAIFVGTKTFGKGSMQISEEISNGGAVNVTIARWLTPAGDLIHQIGINPDVTVEISDEDYENDRDPQLIKQRNCF